MIQAEGSKWRDPSGWIPDSSGVIPAEESERRDISGWIRVMGSERKDPRGGGPKEARMNPSIRL